jgi:hypothetical protein
MSNDWDKNFEDIVSRMSGFDDNSARQNMGEEQFNEFVALSKAGYIMGLQKDEAQIKYLQALAFLQSAAGVGIIFSILAGIGWSIYAWI